MGFGLVFEVVVYFVQDVVVVFVMVMVVEVSKIIKIGCWVFCMGYWLLVVFVKEVMIFDFLFEGRLELGLGVGWIVFEYEVMGVFFDFFGKCIQLFEEMIKFVKQGIKFEQFDVNGDFVNVKGYQFVLKLVNVNVFIMVGGGVFCVLKFVG